MKPKILSWHIDGDPTHYMIRFDDKDAAIEALKEMERRGVLPKMVSLDLTRKITRLCGDDGKLVKGVKVTGELPPGCLEGM